jgi:hypothetical protein
MSLQSLFPRKSAWRSGRAGYATAFRAADEAYEDARVSCRDPRRTKDQYLHRFRVGEGKHQRVEMQARTSSCFWDLSFARFGDYSLPPDFSIRTLASRSGFCP